MNEYICIPSYFDKDKVDCRIVNDFLEKAEYIENKKIDINSLRTYYSLDKENGLRLIDELKMRGFIFVLKSSNALLSTIKPKKNIELIYTDKKDDKIMKLNKTIFNFIEYNDEIKSDFYFNLVPIFAFENVMKDFNYELIKNEFSRYEYEILSKEDIEKKKNNKEIKQNINKINIPEYDSNRRIDILINMIIKENPEFKQYIEKTELEGILPENLRAEKLIKNKLKEDNIIKIEDLKSYNITNLENIRGIGFKSISGFKENIIESFKSSNHRENDLESISNGSELSIYISSLVEENSDLEDVYKNICLNKLLPSNTNTDKKIEKELKRNKIKSIYDLINYDIYNLGDIKNVGVKKVSNVVEIIKSEIDLVKEEHEYLEKGVFYLEEPIFKSLKNYKIIEIITVLYGERDESKANISNKTIKDIQGIKYKDLKNETDISTPHMFYSDIKKIFNINNIVIKSGSKKISDRDKKILNERLLLNKTLEEAGSKFGITRERVRQIEKKELRSYNRRLQNNDFKRSLKLNSENKEYFYIEDLKKILNTENYFVIDMIINGHIKGFYYYEALERIYFENIKNSINTAIEIINEMPEHGYVEEDIPPVTELLSNVFGDINYDESIQILSVYNINTKGKFYFKGNPTNSQMLELIYKYVHKTPLLINESCEEILNKYFKDIFNIEIENSWRSWEGTTNRIDGMILVKPRTYIHVDNIPTKSEIIQKTKEILEIELSEYKYIYADKIFDEINLEFPNQIISKHHIYSIVKFYLSEFYQTSSKNSLRISKKGTKQITNTQYLYDICLENGEILDFKLIKEITGWRKHTIEMAIINSKKLVKIGSRKCAIFNMIFQDDEKEVFQKIVKEDILLGYTTTTRIYFKLIFDETMNKFIKRNKIDDGKDLAALMKMVDSNIIGHNIFMYYGNQDIENIRDVIFDRHPARVLRSDIIDVLEEFKVSTDQTSLHIQDLLMEKRYVQISREEYLNYNDFHVDIDVLEEVVKFFNEKNDENGFVVPINYISEIRRNYKQSKFSWNQYIISTILTQNGYKLLKRFNSDYRYEILILVKQEENYDDISYLIYNLIKNEYKGKLHEIPIYDFLSNKGIYKLETQNCNKKLQYDAKNNKIISVDIVGNVKLKE